LPVPQVAQRDRHALEADGDLLGAHLGLRPGELEHRQRLDRGPGTLGHLVQRRGPVEDAVDELEQLEPGIDRGQLRQLVPEPTDDAGLFGGGGAGGLGLRSHIRWQPGRPRSLEPRLHGRFCPAMLIPAIIFSLKNPVEKDCLNTAISAAVPANLILAPSQALAKLVAERAACLPAASTSRSPVVAWASPEVSMFMRSENRSTAISSLRYRWG
jgi:hypothetical protein